MPATIRRSAQNSNVYRAYGIMSSDRIFNRAIAKQNAATIPVSGELLISVENQ